MKKVKFLLVIVFSLATNLLSQTTISSGTVSGTWTLINSPYHIQGDITIPNDSTLIIEPGVRVEFQGHYALNVQGRLLAIGDVANNIIFTVNDTAGFHNSDTTLGGWYGIRFIDTPSDNDTSKIIFCNISFGKAVSADWFWNAGGAFCILHFDKVVISKCRIINCSAGGSGFAVGGAMAVGWSDVLIVDTYFSKCKADAGGAIHFYESNPILINNIFDGNSAKDGGALDIQTKSHPIISNSQFTNNSAVDAGGAINIGGDSVLATFNECSISGNSANIGGAINAGSCEFQLNNCSITDNSASTHGGGINASYCKIEVNGTNFERDIAKVFGGAMEVFQSELIIINCNLASNGAGIRGGGIHSDSSSLDITNTDFEGDTVTTFGGAIATNNSELYLNNCNLIDNSAGILGGGIHSDYSSISIDNTIFEKDTAGLNGGGIFVWHCDLNIDNCEFKDDSVAFSGGAICSDSSSITINNSNFTKNSAGINGGAIIFDRGSLSINNSDFTQNSAVWGGGIVSTQGELNLEGCTFSDNSSEHGGAINISNCSVELNELSFIRNSSIWGGAISSTNSSLIIDDCLFNQNSADNQGGALEYLADTAGFTSISQLEIKNSIFKENSSLSRCGAALIEQNISGVPLVNVTIDHCEFVNNIALRVGVLRMGNISNFTLSNSKFIGNTVAQHTAACTFASLSSGYIYNCLFINNIAGGGTSGGAGVSNGSEVDFMNCTFANNLSGSGGGIQVRAGSIVTLTNSILWGNFPDQISLDAINDTSDCTLYSNYNDIQFGVDSIHIDDTISVVNWGEGNIDSDPLFVDTLNGDFHLQDLSPCIATGIDSIEITGFWYYSPATDIEGNARPNPTGTRPDMGAYESQFPTRVEEQNLDLPTEYALYQNYPNPFNPNTKIRYSIPTPPSSSPLVKGRNEVGFVSLKVYDVLGNEIKTLINEEKSAGTYEVSWNAIDLPSGVYFYQLKAAPNGGRAGEFIQTRKMILLK